MIDACWPPSPTRRHLCTLLTVTLLSSAPVLVSAADSRAAAAMSHGGSASRSASPSARQPASRSAHRAADRPAAQAARSQTRSRDGRKHLVEGNLRDIDRRLESRPDSRADVVRPAECPTCGERARLPDPPSVAKGNEELRGNLHRLQRDVRERKTPHSREHVIEDKLSRPD